jgi:uncharacterized protein (TIRG00374 family)
MKKYLNAIKYLLLFSVGAVLFYYVYKGLGVEKIAHELENLRWGWVWLSFVFAIASHLSRAIRWNMLITPLGHKPRTLNTFLSVMIMYATNLIIPRGGELARCTLLSRHEKIPFGTLAGTVVIERATDTLILLLLVFITIFSQFGVFTAFVANNPEFEQSFGFLFSLWFWLGGALLGIGSFILLWVYREKLKRLSFVAKIIDLMTNFFQGISSIKNLKNPGWYLFHSFFIYIMYFLMMYVIFFSYQPTEHLSMLAGLTAFIMGGLAMLAPVQGGIGAWHFMVLETLALYGLDKTDGKIFALISHTSMNLMLLIVGAISFMLLPLFNKKKINQEP